MEKENMYSLQIAIIKVNFPKDNLAEKVLLFIKTVIVIKDSSKMVKSMELDRTFIETVKQLMADGY